MFTARRSWLRVGADGRLYAVNPENGFFGVAPGTNEKSNPNALRTTHKNTIFTNVARNLDDNTVWWEKLDKNPPENGEDWLGNPWNGKTSTEKGAHPNSRFTAPAENCPTIADEFFTGEGVPIDAIIFGGRRAKAEPLVHQSRSWDHGVFIGSAMIKKYCGHIAHIEVMPGESEMEALADGTLRMLKGEEVTKQL